MGQADKDKLIAENLLRKYCALLEDNRQIATSIPQRIGVVLAGSLTASGFMSAGVWQFVQSSGQFASGPVKIIVGVLTICGLVALIGGFRKAISLLSNRFGHFSLPVGTLSQPELFQRDAGDQSTEVHDPFLAPAEGIEILRSLVFGSEDAESSLSEEAKFVLFEAEEAQKLYKSTDADLQELKEAASQTMEELYAALLFFAFAVIAGLVGSFLTQTLLG